MSQLGLLLWFIGQSVAERFLGALIAAAFLIVAGVELVFLADDLVFDPVWYRMNTVFKFYNQIWSLLAISAATLFTYMIVIGFGVIGRLLSSNTTILADNTSEFAIAADVEIDEVNTETSCVTGADVSRRWAQVGAVAGAVLLAGGLLYPCCRQFRASSCGFQVIRASARSTPSTGCAMATIEQPDRSGVIQFADDLAAIDWFNDNSRGNPGDRRGQHRSVPGQRITHLDCNRPSDNHRMGSPRTPAAISGGDRSACRRCPHALRQQRPGRKDAHPSKYDVQYVIVGDVERYSYWSGEPYASSEGIAAFDELVGNGLEIAFQSGSTIVYRVLLPIVTRPVFDTSFDGCLYSLSGPQGLGVWRSWERAAFGTLRSEVRVLSPRPL